MRSPIVRPIPCADTTTQPERIDAESGAYDHGTTDRTYLAWHSTQSCPI